MNKYLIMILCCMSFLFIGCTNEEEPTQYSDWLVGKWQVDNSDEYILFTNRDIFIMNDTITGNYEVQEENDKHIWFYAISDSEEYEEDGEMIFTDIKYHKTMNVENLPLHNGETIKIYYLR